MDVKELIKNVEAAASAPPGQVKEEERVKLLVACNKLKEVLETPLDLTTRVIFGPHKAAALRLAIEMKVFDVAANASAKGGKVSIGQLASGTGTDDLLIKRVTRVLAGMGIFKEVGPDVFMPTPHAGAFVTGSPLTEGVVHITSSMEVLSRLSGYFQQNGFKNPWDAYDGPFQYAMRTKLHYFEYLQSTPRLQEAFNTTMSIQRMNKGEEWFEFYPVDQKLQVKADTQPLMVDVGGGLGHDLIAFKEKFSALPGKLIIQDLPIVVDDIKGLPPGIEGMAHNFFEPQPVRGAKAYYLRTVLHDWPDKQARVILANIRAAMNKDSILLINENALPETNVPLYPAQLDLHMMALFSSLDRTPTQFKDLLTASGFEVIGVYTAKNFVPGSGTLFEAVVKP